MSSCFHQMRCSAAGGFGPVVAPQTTMRPPGRAASSERFQVASPTVSTTTSAPPVASFTAATTSPDSWLTVDVGAERRRLRQLLVARRGDDRPGAERLGDPERRRRDAAADPPDEHPLARLQSGARDEHPVGGLVDERERGRVLERDTVAERARRSSQGSRRARRGRPACARRSRGSSSPCSRPGLITTGCPGSRPSTSVAERLDDAGAVGAEDARLRHGGQALPRPDVEMVERGEAHPHEHLARGRARGPGRPRSGGPPARRPRG